MKLNNTIWSIGHSTHDRGKFLRLLQAHKIDLVADIRSYPGSRKSPHFSKESMPEWLLEYDIGYIHLPKLGGFRKKSIDNSPNTGWRKESFQFYADYCLSDSEFDEGLAELIQLVRRGMKVAYMCSESCYFKCHRWIVSDYLLNAGLDVLHIGSDKKTCHHQLNSMAHVLGDKIIYNEWGGL